MYIDTDIVFNGFLTQKHPSLCARSIRPSVALINSLRHKYYVNTPRVVLLLYYCVTYTRARKLVYLTMIYVIKYTVLTLVIVLCISTKEKENIFAFN